jgi:flagellin
MSLRINTNIQSQNALRNVSLTSDMMGRTIERLASGLRVNRAADDPAGLIISENLRAQITGLQQAVNNAQDAVNMIKTAEAALDEVHNALRTMRQLTLHAANTGVNDYASLQADQTQIRALIDSINRIAEQTSFGTKNCSTALQASARRSRTPSAFRASSSAGCSTTSPLPAAQSPCK